MAKNSIAHHPIAHQERLNCYQQLDRSPSPETANTQQPNFHQLAIELLIAREQTYIDWLKRAIESIDR
jgi:hypothetical protein